MEYDNASHGVGAVHQTRRALYDLDIVDPVGVNLDSVLIAPLLSLLTYTVRDHDNTIVAEATDNRLRYSRTCSDLTHTRFPCYGVYDIT